MSFRATAHRRLYLLLFLASLAASSTAFAQLATSPIAFSNEEAITTSFVPTPTVVSAPGSGPSDNNQWLKVEFHYGTTSMLTTPYVDEVTFKIWIEGVDPQAANASQASGKGVAIALTGSVTYINIPANKDIYGVFYVHPSTLGRYSDDRGATQYDEKYNIHMEAYINGTKMDYSDKRKDPQGLDWYKALKPVPNLVYTQNQCPFMLEDPDRYPAIKLPPPPTQ